MSWIWYLIIGAVAGWLSGRLMHGRGFGFFMNTVIGLLGGAIGGFVFPLIGLHIDRENIIGSLLMALVGAVLLLWFITLLKKK